MAESRLLACTALGLLLLYGSQSQAHENHPAPAQKEIPAAGPVLPPVTARMRAAAFPELADDGHPEHEALYWMFLLEQLEWQDRDAGDTLRLKTRAWIGRDFDRLWLRAEGARTRGERGRGELELLWGHAVAAWWDLMAGIRQDLGAGRSRSYAAFGVQGLAPWWLEVELTGYLGKGGQAGLRLDVEHELLLTNRLILTPEFEVDLWRRDDVAAGIGSGIGALQLGLRLRYEIRREFAPYLGVERHSRLGESADLARAAGGAVRDVRAVAGVRLWF